MRATGVVAVATGSMAASMLPLYTMSTLGPFLVADLGLSLTAVGGLITAVFAVGAAASMFAGRAVDATGARVALAVLFALVGGTLLATSYTAAYYWLLTLMAIAGLGLALANPATNVLIARDVEAPLRAVAIGIKQSGVQLAALTCGIVLPPIAASFGWPAGLRVAALVPITMLFIVWWRVPPAATTRPSGTWWRWSPPSAWLVWLMGYSLLLGTALAAVNTYLPLYASQQLGMATATAGAVLAAFGVSGLVARLWWTRFADRQVAVTAVLVWLSIAAAAFALLVWAAAWARPELVWLGAVGVGATATGGNAVSMLAVVRHVEAAGHASAMVSLGFFTGFVIGPAGFGSIADALAFDVSWIVVSVLFGLAGLVAAFIPHASRPLQAIP